MGVAALDNQLSKKPIPEEVIEGLELFTSQAAVAIENAKLYEQLRMYADELEITDHLTQLFTFFHFKKLLQGEIDRARVSAQPVCLALFSIENFARYNERLGHRHGDDVLRRVAQTIRDGARKQDIIGRCFGSTFAVVFPGTPEEEASGRVEQMRVRLEGLGYPGEEALPEGRLRFRWAVASYARGEGSTAEDFVSQVVEKSKNPAA